MKPQDFLGNIFQAGPFDARRCPGEIRIDHGPVDPHGLEDLRAAIAGQGGDPHLGHNLQDSVFDCLLVILQCQLSVYSGQAVIPPVFGAVTQKMNNCLKGNVGVNHAGPISKQTGKVMLFPGLSSLGDNACPHPLALPDQMMMHRAHG